MIESILILLVVIGFVLMLISFYWESLALSAVTFVIWIGLSIGIYQIEIPYTAIQSDNTIVTGTHNIENMYMYGYFFIALAIIMFLYMITMVFQMWQNKEKRIM